MGGPFTCNILRRIRGNTSSAYKTIRNIVRVDSTTDETMTDQFGNVLSFNVANLHLAPATPGFGWLQGLDERLVSITFGRHQSTPFNPRYDLRDDVAHDQFVALFQP